MSQALERAAEELNQAVRDRDAGRAAPLLDDQFSLTSSLGTGLHVDKAAWIEGLDAIETDELAARDVQAQVFGDVGVAVRHVRFGHVRGTVPRTRPDVTMEGPFAWNRGRAVAGHG